MVSAREHLSVLCGTIPKDFKMCQNFVLSPIHTCRIYGRTTVDIGLFTAKRFSSGLGPTSDELL